MPHNRSNRQNKSSSSLPVNLEQDLQKSKCSDEAKAEIRRLRALAGRVHATEEGIKTDLFEMGRGCDELVRRHKLTLTQISGYLSGYSVPRLSQLRNTYLAFKNPKSREGLTFSIAEQARRVNRRLPKDQKARLTPVVIARKMMAQGLTTRQASSLYQRQVMRDRNKQARTKARKTLRIDSSTVQMMRHADCLLVGPTLAPKSIKLLHLDPPYGEFRKAHHGGYTSGKEATNGLRTDCDNNEASSALAVSTKVFGAFSHAIADDGCILYWSAGNRCDRPEIVLAAKEAGFECLYAGFWLKHLTQPGNFSEPFTTKVERFLLFYRKGAKGLDHSQELPRGDVITPDDLLGLKKHASPSQRANGDFIAGRKCPGDVHMFEKPVGLCRFFIDKLTFPDDLVVDAFGCSGNMCIAAHQAERRWLYIESNAQNHAWGVSRIAAALDLKDKRSDPEAGCGVAA